MAVEEQELQEEEVALPDPGEVEGVEEREEGAEGVLSDPEEERVVQCPNLCLQRVRSLCEVDVRVEDVGRLASCEAIH